jgi:hypothetical protein
MDVCHSELRALHHGNAHFTNMENVMQFCDTRMPKIGNVFEAYLYNACAMRMRHIENAAN